MKVFSHVKAACELARALHKPVLYLGFNPDHPAFAAEWDKAAPYLTYDDNETMQAVFDGNAIIVCDSDKERDRLYNLTVGDDGPTKTNSYDGPVRVYALTIDRTGQTLNENT